MTTFNDLRRLALEEAQLEFPDSVLPGTSWCELDTCGLKMALGPLSLKILFKREKCKRKALVELLLSISKAETDDPELQALSSKFLAKHGFDADQYPDEDPTLPPEEKLFRAIFSRRQRSRFYFEVEELAGFLDGARAKEFRQAV